MTDDPRQPRSVPLEELPNPFALATTRKGHPSYEITADWRLPGQIRYTALARTPDTHPVVVVSASLAELERYLDPRDRHAQGVAQVYQLRAGDEMSS